MIGQNGDMSDTSARLLRLLSLLQTHRDWTGPALAERLGVSARTVRRDVDRLRELGYPVHATQGTAGYRLGAGTRLPPLLLDDEEAVAVAVSLASAAGGTVEGIEETALRALAKLEQVLPSRLRHRVAAVGRATVRVDAPAPTVEAATLLHIAETTRRRERLRFDYRAADGASSLREVEPQALVSWGRRWYLVAWDVGRDDWRSFRVDRLAPKQVTGPAFPPRDPPEGDVTRYLERQLAVRTWPSQAVVTLHVPAEAVADRLWLGMGSLEAIDERTCRLQVGAESPDNLAWLISSIGVEFTITDPPEVVAAMAALAGRCARSVATNVTADPS
jgi:predicted DNA-binding transcriptional regulator YafY